MPVHIVSQGECVYSIAADYGLFWETIWKDPENLDLRQLRTDPNLLCEGDELFIPDVTIANQDASTEQRHQFKRKGIPAKLKLVLLNNGEPRKNEGWKANIDGSIQSGTTDDQGKTEITLDPRTPTVRLTLDSGVEYILNLRHLDPIETISGVQARLNNLGYECGPVDGIVGPHTEGGVRAFQADYPPLEVDGIIGPHTRAKLKEVYGC